MQKLTPAFAATTVIAGIMSVYLWQQLNAERFRTQALQQRVAELEQARQAPAVAVAPTPATQQSAAPAAAQSNTQGTTTAAAEGKRTSDPAISINSTDLMKDPDYRAAVTPMVRQALAQNYPDLAKELGISPQQAGKLLDILANAALAGMSSSTGSGVADARELAQAGAEARRKQEAEILALLGDAKTQQWNDYQQTLPARQQVSRLGTALESSGNNLSQQQRQQLTVALAAEQKRQTADATQTAQIMGAAPGNAPSRDAVSMLEQQLQRTEESNRRVQELAGSYLTQQQLDALKTQQNQELQMTRALLRAQRGRPENGQAPGNATIVIGGPTGRP